MWKRIVVLLASILVARAPAANAKAFYVNCHLKGTRSGTNVMRAKMLMGHRAIDSVNLIRTSSNSYRPGDTIKVKISNLKGIGSVINFSGGQVADPPGYEKWECPKGISNFHTHDHGEGVPRKYVLTLKIPSPPPASITISALTADPYGAVTRQSHTIFLSATQSMDIYEEPVMRRECGRREMLRFMNTQDGKMARMDYFMRLTPKCTVMKWRIVCDLCSNSIDDDVFSACVRSWTKSTGGSNSSPRISKVEPPALKEVCLQEAEILAATRPQELKIFASMRKRRRFLRRAMFD